MIHDIFPATSRMRSRGGPFARRRHAQLLGSLRTVLLASIVIVGALSADARAATVATDQPDYAPGQTVVITGTGWEPGETVVLVLQEDPAIDPDLQLTAVADENGDIVNMDFIVDVFDIGVSFTLTATGTSSGLAAVTTFTDACNRCNCGDGILQTAENEQCDEGAAVNGTPGSCCTSQCTFKNSNQTCRAAAGECDSPETCSGSGG